MGRIPTGKVPEQALEFLRPRHRQIMMRLITGQNHVRISEDLDITQSRLSIIINSPLFISELRKMEREVFDNLVETRGDITGKVRELQPKALKVLSDMMEEKTTGKALKRACANDILGLDKKRQTGEDDGLNPFARMIQDAFKIASKVRDEERKASEVTPVLEKPVNGERVQDDPELSALSEPIEVTPVAKVEPEEEPVSDTVALLETLDALGV